MAKTVADVMKMVKENEVKFVDFRFTDTRGKEQHVTVPISHFDEEKFSGGHAFDGSSIAGWKGIEASDMQLMPDPNTANIDPFFEEPTLILTCDVIEPGDGKPYERDPRSLAKRAEAYLKSSGYGDVANFGPEPEFFVFDNVRYDSNNYSAFYEVDSAEGFWNTGSNDGPNLGYKIRPKSGYFPVPPHDTLMDIRSEMLVTMESLGIPVEVHHHEVGTAGQCEIDMRFGPLTQMADNVQTYKYVVRNVARKHGKVATFMPKPIFGDNGSGMHVHQSIWKGGKNQMFNKDAYAGLSDFARYYIGGLLRHGPALLALAAPTVNSYRRLVPGFEAPVNLVYSQRNRSAAVRIPVYSKSEKAKRIEFRCPDTAANPYLCFAALLMAGLDGVKNKIEPGEPADFDLYEASPEELARIKSTPGSLGEVLCALEADHAFLLEGGVFTQDLIDTWISYKRTNELAPINLRPTPYEFYLYFDV
ncbi:MAG: glutamine synthetase [Thermomicrobiales bacterium]|nr:glutamine synthetase [Thermomicrobiales bacterium]